MYLVENNINNGIASITEAVLSFQAMQDRKI